MAVAFALAGAFLAADFALVAAALALVAVLAVDLAPLLVWAKLLGAAAAGFGFSGVSAGAGVASGAETASYIS